MAIVLEVDLTNEMNLVVGPLTCDDNQFRIRSPITQLYEFE